MEIVQYAIMAINHDNIEIFITSRDVTIATHPKLYRTRKLVENAYNKLLKLLPIRIKNSASSPKIYWQDFAKQEQQILDTLKIVEVKTSWDYLY